MARSGCLYGSTGTRKTTQVKWFSHYIAETTGKATALISMDGGGWGPCQPEIDAEMIEAFYCDPSLVPLPTLRNLSRGYWPEDVRAPANKVNLVEMDWNKFGGVAIEGWTSITAAVMRYLPDKGINVGGEEREKLGGFSQSVRVKGQLVNENFRSSTRGDYGFVQNFLYGLVLNFNALPCRYVLYTALESRTEEDDRSTVYGPAISGKKATNACGAWVGDMIHAQDYSVEKSITVPNPQKPSETMDQLISDIDVRFYFKKHPDPVTGICYPAKPRVTPEQVIKLDKKCPGGYFECDASGGLDRYLSLVDQLTKERTDTLVGWRKRMDEKLGRGAAATATVAAARAAIEAAAVPVARTAQTAHLPANLSGIEIKK